jgi:hypothetical protein
MKQDASMTSIQEALESMSTEDLFKVFEPAFRRNLELREPMESLDSLIDRFRTTMNRDALLKLARMMPAMIKGLKERPTSIGAASPAKGLTTSTQSVSNLELHPGNSDVQMIETKLSIPPLDETVLNGIYMVGGGKAFVTTSREFEISEGNFARAMAWNRRLQ